MNISFKPWKKKGPPKRILAIRLQAMGDVVITLPYLLQLRKSLPSSVSIDFLTRMETGDIPKNIILFDRVFVLGGARSHRKQLLLIVRLLPQLFFRRYDIVIDLQNNLISRIVRTSLFPKAWSAFDKYSANAAGERNRSTIEAIGLGPNRMETSFSMKAPVKGTEILKQYGWKGSGMLVVLNPAGFFETRNWPMQYYFEFTELWLAKFPDSQFLILGTASIADKAQRFKMELGDRLINLVGATTPFEAFSILQYATLVLSEDSGLMHMSWVSGVPTLSLFGSTRSDWSRPLGVHSFFFDSADLPCGNCMSAVCRMGDLRCLTRVTPAMVFEQACRLVVVAGKA